MTNQYDDFRRVMQEASILAEECKKVSENPIPSMKSKGLAASLYAVPGTEDYRNYFRNASSEEVYSVLAKRANQVNEQVEREKTDNLEGILYDAPDELISFAAKNTKPVKTEDGDYETITRLHENYRDMAQALHDYDVEGKRLDARKVLLSAVDKSYDERFADNEDKDLMKKIARFSDDVLKEEYSYILQEVENKFIERLKGNEVSYLFKNVKDVDNSDFINYLVSGKKEYLIENAKKTGDVVGVKSISEEVKMDQMANMTKSEIKQLILQNYEQAGDYAEGNLSVSRDGSGIQAPVNRVPLATAASAY